MRKMLLSALFVAAISPAIAQDTLTGPLLNSVLGNSYTTINCDTSAASLQLAIVRAERGANRVWNYTGLTPISSDTAYALACNHTSACSLFVAATNQAAKTISSSSYAYSVVNNDSVSSTGYFASSTQNLILTNPMKQLKYPMRYLDSFTDAYAGTATYVASGFNVSATENGINTVVVDGWGILKTPISTDSNVLRVHASTSFIDSIAALSAGGSFTTNTFYWYKRNYHSPLMTINFFDQYSGPITPYLHTKTVSYAMRYPLGISNVTLAESTLAAYPNPATDKLNVSFELATTEKVSVTLFDIFGRSIATLANAELQGHQEITLNTEAMPRGWYVIRLQTNEGAVTRKVCLQ